jgi:hypothetical protein
MIEAMANFLADRGGDTGGGGGFFKGVQNWANGVNKRMSGQAPAMSGLFPGMQTPQMQQSAQSNMAQPNPTMIDSFKRISDLFSSPMHSSVPMSTSYSQMPVPNYGAAAPTPYGVRQSMATPYNPMSVNRGAMWQ